MKPTKEDILQALYMLKPTLRQKGVAKIALFGSFATATQTPYSDIDIAIVKREDFLKHFRAYDYFEMRNELCNTLMKKFHRNVDIFDMDSTSPLKEDIQKEAIYV